jgi:hypothetical protein
MLKDIFKRFIKTTLSAARASSGEFLLKKTDFGLVHVEYSVIQKIAADALKQLKEIQDAEVVVDPTGSKITPIKIRLTLTLTEGCSAPRARQAADTVINDALKNLLQPGFYVPVEVRVNQITRPVPQKRQRVR